MMAATTNLIERERAPHTTVAYEHPFVVRLAHWLWAIALFVLIGSGLQIFRAFPSFGPKIPQQNFFIPPRAFSLGGWLAGGIMWHFTFMWVFVGSGLLYVIYQIVSGHWRQVLFLPRDIKGVWPMVRYYFLFGKKPPVEAAYNPLQKLAYTASIFFGVISTLTGLVLYKPVQFWWLTWLMGGFRLARVWHFVSMCGFVAFIAGHLIMVMLHGWNNFYSMLTGWKRSPEYLRD
jgi:Ni/Fe-hydrogenase b-type cytochrome subunit